MFDPYIDSKERLDVELSFFLRGMDDHTGISLVLWELQNGYKPMSASEMAMASKEQRERWEKELILSKLNANAKKRIDGGAESEKDSDCPDCAGAGHGAERVQHTTD